MKTAFSQRHPYGAAIISGLLCTLFTALGMAIPQIFGLDEMLTITVMTIAVAVSAAIGILIMKKSRFTIAEYGFNKYLSKNTNKVWFYIPLIVIELIPIIVYGFNNKISAPMYIMIALFTISVGFNEEIYFRGLAFKFISDRGVKKAIIWSSVIFGILHIANALNGKDLPYIILQVSFAFLIGFVFAEIVSITKSIWVVIICHFAHDFISMSTGETLDRNAIIILAVQTVILLIYAIVLWKTGIEKNIDTNRPKSV